MQANTFDIRRNQQGFFTYLHKWVIVAKQQSQLDDIEFVLGNISNVVAVVLRDTAQPIEQVCVNVTMSLRFILRLRYIIHEFS